MPVFNKPRRPTWGVNDSNPSKAEVLLLSGKLHLNFWELREVEVEVDLVKLGHSLSYLHTHTKGIMEQFQSTADLLSISHGNLLEADCSLNDWQGIFWQHLKRREC